MSELAVRACESAEVLPFRVRRRLEMNCQVVHDSIHRRPGWTNSFLLEVAGAPAGFASIAVGGPWENKPTVFEMYVAPPHRTRAFALFERFLEASGARFFEVQSNDTLLAVMLHTYGRDITSEKIVFQDHATTALPANGARLRALTGDDQIREAIAERQGGGEWVLDLEDAPAATGGILFHYNQPYGDIYMEVKEPLRRRGLGAYLVQELKRLCYQLGAVPTARCDPGNIASRQTLQKAGLAPFAHILVGRRKG